MRSDIKQLKALEKYEQSIPPVCVKCPKNCQIDCFDFITRKRCKLIITLEKSLEKSYALVSEGLKEEHELRLKNEYKLESKLKKLRESQKKILSKKEIQDRADMWERIMIDKGWKLRTSKAEKARCKIRLIELRCCLGWSLEEIEAGHRIKK
jgi:hypothetical protein